MAHFRRDRIVLPEDCDELGHVNNVTWVRFVVELAVAHSETAGFGTPRYRELGAWWVVHRHEVDYRVPALPGEVLEEETWVAEMRGARCLRQSRFIRAKDSALLVEAATTWVWTEAQTGRPRRIPPEVSAVFLEG